jgi:hypothetical protein
MFGISALGSVSDVQGQLGVPNTNEWDAATLAALARFQGQDGGELKMHVTGVADPATLINLGYYDPMDELPRKQAQYLAGDRDQPTTFWRDTATLSNQVPQWIWIVAGVAMTGFGYWVYRRNKKREKGTA